ncbi:MAG: ribosome maturation factor RimP [Oscillospiraceae bacterium]|nr:ribosome maturation factor RimP [Oscillospiraceae bacterium]
MKKITELTAELAAPAIAEQGCQLWDVEYVKEAGTWYLRVLLDKEGGVDILDCEAISRKLSDLLDEADPIEGSYTLEVGSAGAERALKRPGDFQRFMGSPVLVKLYRAQNGSKEFAGTLTAYDGESGDVTITAGGKEMTFSKKDTALVRLRVEF